MDFFIFFFEISVVILDILLNAVRDNIVYNLFYFVILWLTYRDCTGRMCNMFSKYLHSWFVQYY